MWSNWGYSLERNELIKDFIVYGNTWLRDQKLLILDYLKKTVNNVSPNTTNIQGGVLEKKSFETFKQNSWKMPQ